VLVVVVVLLVVVVVVLLVLVVTVVLAFKSLCILPARVPIFPVASSTVDPFHTLPLSSRRP
jgi:hypothetical protein